MTTLFYIHGGTTFSTEKEYIKYLKERRVSLEEKNSWSGKFLKDNIDPSVQLVKPRMPRSEMAQYKEWEIMADRYLEEIKEPVILIGNSLGGMFWAQYLATKKVTNKIKTLILVAPPFDNTLSDEELSGGFELPKNLKLIEEQVENITILMSEDDPVVPTQHLEKYKKALPSATCEILKNKNGHFQVEEFPEIIEIVNKNLI